MRSSVPSIETVAKFWDRQPCNVRHGIALVGSIEWSEQVTARRYFVEPHIINFAQFSRWEGKHVLEVGCGIGTDTLEFAKIGALVDAVDISARSIELAKIRMCTAKSTTGPFAHFTTLDAERTLPWANDYKWEEVLYSKTTFVYSKGYDLVYSFGVIHHTPDPESLVRNVFSRLKPGGEFRLMLYAKRSIKNAFKQQVEAQPGCPIAKTYSRRMVKKLLQDFEIESITQAHIFPWRIKDYVQHEYVMEWYYRWMPSWLFNWLQRRLGWHLLIVAKKPA